MNTSLHFSGPGIKILDHMVIVCLIFYETIQSFSTEAIPFYGPTHNACDLVFPYHKVILIDV
jgi:hypothetical protein